MSHGRLPSYGPAGPLLPGRTCPKCAARLVRVRSRVMCFEGACDYEGTRLHAEQMPARPRHMPEPYKGERTRVGYILGYLEKHPWSGPNAIAKVLSMAPQTVLKVLSALLGAGRVQRVYRTLSTGASGYYYALPGEERAAA